jgi:hypothetical protein
MKTVVFIHNPFFRTAKRATSLHVACKEIADLRAIEEIRDRISQRSRELIADENAGSVNAISDLSANISSQIYFICVGGKWFLNHAIFAINATRCNCVRLNSKILNWLKPIA